MTFEKNVFSGVPVCHEKMRTGIWVTWTRIVGGGGRGAGGGFGGIVRLQKDLSLLTTKRSCSKSGVVNDRKVRDRVEGVD